MLSAVILQVAQVTYVHTHTHTHTKNPTHQPLIPTVSNSSTYAFQECMYLCVWQIIHLRQSYTHTHTRTHTHTHTHTKKADKTAVFLLFTFISLQLTYHQCHHKSIVTGDK